MPREIPEVEGRTIARLEIPAPGDPADTPFLRIEFAEGGDLVVRVGEPGISLSDADDA
jgi:hypothetical protein